MPSTYISQALQSANTDDGKWNTPQHLKDAIYEKYDIEFDPCPIRPDFDGLQVDWAQNNFCNPPFHDITRWVEKILEEQRKGKNTVLLMPARTCTHYFQDLIVPNISEIVFVQGRVRYVNQDGSTHGAAPWPTILCIFKGHTITCESQC